MKKKCDRCRELPSKVKADMGGEIVMLCVPCSDELLALLQRFRNTIKVFTIDTFYEAVKDALTAVPCSPERAGGVGIVNVFFGVAPSGKARMDVFWGGAFQGIDQEERQARLMELFNGYLMHQMTVKRSKGNGGNG